jgi:serine/threonine-protein kinase RsbW
VGVHAGRDQPRVVAPTFAAEVGGCRTSAVDRGVERLPTSRLDDVQLAASEVVTNAVLHGDGPVVCRVWLGVNVVRMEVADDGEEVPRLRGDLVDDGEGGRGLRIVDALASRWGVTPKRPGPGKTVWFESGQEDTDPPGEEE